MADGIRTVPAAGPEVTPGRPRRRGPSPEFAAARRRRRRTTSWRFGGGLGQLVLLLVAVVWLLPTLGLLISSLRSPAADASSGWWTVLLHPSGLNVTNYQALLRDPAILRSVVNTVLITVPATVLVVVIGALAAYAFAWMRFPGRDWLFLVVVGLLIVPVQVGLIPVAKLYSLLHIYGSILSVVLFHVAFGLPLAIFLLRNYFAGIPQELLESVRIDGGSDLVIFRRIVLPLGLPAIAALSIFQFLWVWNDFLGALIFANSANQPLTVELQSQVREFTDNINVLAPGAFLSITIPLIVFFAFQRYFVEGLLAGSTK